MADRITTALTKLAPKLAEISDAFIQANAGQKSFGEVWQAARAAKLKKKDVESQIQRRSDMTKIQNEQLAVDRKYKGLNFQHKLRQFDHQRGVDEKRLGLEGERVDIAKEGVDLKRKGLKQRADQFSKRLQFDVGAELGRAERSERAIKVQEGQLSLAEKRAAISDKRRAQDLELKGLRLQKDILDSDRKHSLEVDRLNIARGKELAKNTKDLGQMATTVAGNARDGMSALGSFEREVAKPRGLKAGTPEYNAEFLKHVADLRHRKIIDGFKVNRDEAAMKAEVAERWKAHFRKPSAKEWLFQKLKDTYGLNDKTAMAYVSGNIYTTKPDEAGRIYRINEMDNTVEQITGPGSGFVGPADKKFIDKLKRDAKGVFMGEASINMEKAIKEGTGFWSAVWNGVGQLGSAFFDTEEWAPAITKAKHQQRFLNNFIKSALRPAGDQGRFSNYEMKSVEALLPKPDTWVQSSATAWNEFNVLKQQIRNMKAQYSGELLMSVEGEGVKLPRKDVERLMGRISVMNLILRYMGDPSDIANDQGIPSPNQGLRNFENKYGLEPVD